MELIETRENPDTGVRMESYRFEKQILPSDVENVLAYLDDNGIQIGRILVENEGDDEYDSNRFRDLYDNLRQFNMMNPLGNRDLSYVCIHCKYHGGEIALSFYLYSKVFSISKRFCYGTEELLLQIEKICNHTNA